MSELPTLSEKEEGGLQITYSCESTTAKCHKINVLKIFHDLEMSKSWRLMHTLIYYFFQLFFHKSEIIHTFNKSYRRKEHMSVVTDGILSTHWQYSRIILINSNTVLPKRERERWTRGTQNTRKIKLIAIQKSQYWFCNCSMMGFAQGRASRD